MVEGERSAYAHAAHDDERNTVGQGIGLVRLCHEQSPTLVEKQRVDLNHLDAGTAEQSLADLHGLRVASATVRESDDFGEHVGGRDEWRESLSELGPVPSGFWVMAIVGRLEGDQLGGVNENGPH